MMIRILFIIILVVTGLLFVGSVLLMSPKGGLGLGIGGMANTSEYGSKKSLEGTLKKVAYATGTIFVVVSLFLPYVMRG